MQFWRIYYEDESTFSDLEGTPWDAPTLGVQFVIQRMADDKWNVISGADCYVYDPDREGWWGGKHIDADLHRARAAKPCVLLGSMINANLFNKIARQVFQDIPTTKKYWYHFQEEHAPYEAYSYDPEEGS